MLRLPAKSGFFRGLDVFEICYVQIIGFDEHKREALKKRYAETWEDAWKVYDQLERKGVEVFPPEETKDVLC